MADVLPATAQTYRGLDEIAALFDEWQAASLRHGRNRPYCGAGYGMAVLETYHKDDDPVVVVARGADGQLRGLMPLVRRDLVRMGLRVREYGFPNNPNVILNDPLVAAGDNAALVALLGAIDLGQDSLILDHMPAVAGLASGMGGAAAGLRLTQDAPRPARSLYFATLGGSYDDFLATRSRNHRWQLKKTIRKAEEAGALEVRRYRGGEIRAALPDWWAVEQRSWQGQNPASAMDDADRAFHTALLDRLQPEELGDLWITMMEGRPVAALRMLAAPGVVSVHTMHFDAGYRKQAPGLIAFDAMFRAACEEGLTEVDMHGRTEFFTRWATGQRAHETLRLYRGGIKGGLIRRGRQASLRLSGLAQKCKTPAKAEG